MRSLSAGILSTSLLKAAKGSDAAQSIVKDWKRSQIATTVQQKIVVDGVLGLAPCHNSQKCRYTEVINLRFPHCGIASLAQVSTMGLCPLLLIQIGKRHEVKNEKTQNHETAAEHRSFTSFQMVHTHASLPQGFSFFPLVDALIGALITDDASQRLAAQNAGKITFKFSFR